MPPALLMSLGGLALALVLYFAFGWNLRRRTDQTRHRLEDALKHLFDLEYRGRRGSLASLTGVLRVADRVALDLVSRMQTQSLLVTRGSEFDLTSEGKRLALQVIRAHRLLERYFADEARLPLPKVHAAAERGEHHLSPDAADRLSASLGHPVVDPHGDPIPTRDGFVPPAAGTPATAWPLEQLARVVHLEDEPPISYAQLVAAGVAVGQTMRIIASTPERLVMTDGENEFRLAPAVAANIFLAAAPRDSGQRSAARLADLATGQAAQVLGLDEACQGYSRRRLMDLGFTEGATIRPALSTFAGDPRAYEIRGTLVALRRDQASQVLVLPQEQVS
ncbi:MAG: metal-dependent transcriptional regulator [Acidobacteria bacterium]|nr:metal-dependent transcriptional regulator [Acidobacteriota bacterium]